MLLECTVCIFNGFKFASIIGGLCEKKCPSVKSCRKFGQYLCLCEKGKKGTDCKEKGMSSLFFALVGFLWDTLVVNSTNLSERLLHKYTVLVYTC